MFSGQKYSWVRQVRDEGQIAVKAAVKLLWLIPLKFAVRTLIPLSGEGGGGGDWSGGGRKDQFLALPLHVIQVFDGPPLFFFFFLIIQDFYLQGMFYNPFMKTGFPFVRIP